MKINYLAILAALISLIFVCISGLEKGYLSYINLFTGVVDGIIIGYNIKNG